MDTAYAPRPGSKGDQALQHLRCHGVTSSIDLADLIDCPVNNVKNNIALCLQHRLIAKVKTPEGVSYDVGDGTPLAADEPDAPPPAEASNEAAQIEGKEKRADHAEGRSGPRRKVKAPRTVGTKPKKPKRVPRQAPAPQTLPATQAAQPRADRAPGTFAFVSDGSLEIYGVNGAVTVRTTAKLRAMAELFGSA